MNAKNIWIIAAVVFVLTGACVGVWILSDSFARLSKTVQRAEEETRERLRERLDSILTERVEITGRIDSLENVIRTTDERINKQIEKYRNETFKNLRDYRDSSNNALLDRLRGR
jgi:hypothetical protein